MNYHRVVEMTVGAALDPIHNLCLFTSSVEYGGGSTRSGSFFIYSGLAKYPWACTIVFVDNT